MARLRQLAVCVFDVSKSMGRELTAQDFIRMLSCQASDIYGTDRLYTRLLTEALQDGLNQRMICTGLDLYSSHSKNSINQGLLFRQCCV